MQIINCECSTWVVKEKPNKIYSKDSLNSLKNNIKTWIWCDE